MFLPTDHGFVYPMGIPFPFASGSPHPTFVDYFLVLKTQVAPIFNQRVCIFSPYVD